MITFITVSGKRLTFKNSDLNISTMGSDFIISLKGVPRALDWPEDDYISISDLYKVITNKWTYIQEEDTDDECEDCEDGNCNNGCFYYRHKRVDSIKIFSNFEDRLRQFCHSLDILIIEQDKKQFNQLLPVFVYYFDPINDDLALLSEHFSISQVEDINERMDTLTQKLDIIERKNVITIDVDNPNDGSTLYFEVHNEGISCDSNLHLFSQNEYYINIDAYTSCNHWGDKKPGRLVTKIEIDGKKSNDDALNKIFIDEVTFKYLRLQKINGSNKYALISYK